MRILVAEDDSQLASFLSKGLSSEHYAVDVAADGEEAGYLASEYEYDLIILDLNLPRVQGFQVIRQVKDKKPGLPILILSGRSKIEDRVRGLDLGADDYLTKPFSFSELSARVRAVMRRGQQPAPVLLRVGDLEMNRAERRVTRGGRRIELTPKEFSLLEYLMRNQGRAVTRAMIIEHVWNITFDTMTNVVDVYVNYLRRKIDEGFDLKLIRTVRGVGYSLRQESRDAA